MRESERFETPRKECPRVINLKVQKTLSGVLRLPPEVVGNTQLITLHGNSCVQVERHCGLIHYAPECVILALPGGRVTVRGDGLRLGTMSRESVVIRGTVFAVELT